MNFEQFWQENQEKIKEQMKALYDESNQNHQWEPEGGDWYVDTDGIVTIGRSLADTRSFGTERKTEELAKAAAFKMRQFNRLLAYVDEACGGYKFSNERRNYYVYFDHKKGRFYCDSYIESQVLSAVFMPENVAIELVKKLNSGEVVL